MPSIWHAEVDSKFFEQVKILAIQARDRESSESMNSSTGRLPDAYS